jgi:hypothetical protein
MTLDMAKDYAHKVYGTDPSLQVQAIYPDESAEKHNVN